jgi:hypothetical protein
MPQKLPFASVSLDDVVRPEAEIATSRLAPLKLLDSGLLGIPPDQLIADAASGQKEILYSIH